LSSTDADENEQRDWRRDHHCFRLHPLLLLAFVLASIRHSGLLASEPSLQFVWHESWGEKEFLLRRWLLLAGRFGYYHWPTERFENKRSVRKN